MVVQDIERAVDSYKNVLDLPVMNRDGPWVEVDAHGVRVGLNGREPEGSGLPLSAHAAATWRLPRGCPIDNALEDVFASGSGIVGLAPGPRSTHTLGPTESSFRRMQS